MTKRGKAGRQDCGPPPPLVSSSSGLESDAAACDTRTQTSNRIGRNGKCGLTLRPNPRFPARVATIAEMRREFQVENLSDEFGQYTDAFNQGVPRIPATLVAPPYSISPFSLIAPLGIVSAPGDTIIDDVRASRNLSTMVLYSIGSFALV